MPYKDKDKQRAAIRKASREFRQRQREKRDILTREDVERILRGHLNSHSYEILYGKKREAKRK